MKYSNPEVQKAYEMFKQEKYAEEQGFPIDNLTFYSEAKKDIRPSYWERKATDYDIEYGDNKRGRP